MQHWVRAFAVGLLSASAANAQQLMLGDYLEPALARLLVPGIALGLAGGVAAAVMPWGDRSWGAREGLKAIVLGFIVGTVAALVLTGVQLSSLADRDRAIKWGLEFVCGYLAAEVLRKLRDTGVRGILEAVLRRTPPTAVSPKEPEP